MTTASQSPEVRYRTLADYLQVLRRYWVALLVIALVGGAAGLAYAKSQTASYRASAEVNFQDPFQDLGVVGLASSQPQSPGQLAVVAANLVTSPAVMDQVARVLRPSASAQSLGGSISAEVAVPSNLLVITATSPDPARAAELANATARVLVKQDNAQARAQFAQAASVVQRRISVLTSHGGTPSNNSEVQFYEDELGRLQTLSSFAKAAQFVYPAAIPIAPTSTSAARSTALGLLFGLLLGVLVAFLRDSFDRRLRDGRDVQSSLEAPILGHVRNQALGGVVHLGAGPRRELDLEAFRIIRRNLELLDPESPPKVIAVTSALADEGKTTVAGSLAVAMAAAGRRTLLIECDLRRPALASRLQLDVAPGLTDYLTGQAGPQQVLRTIAFAEAPAQNGSARGNNGSGPSGNGHVPGATVHRLVCVPSGSRTARPAELIGSPRFPEMLEQVSATYDAVVLDCSPLLPVSDTLEVLSHVDAVVLCVRESQTTREQASAAQAALGRWPGCRVGIVVTGIRPRSAGDDVVYAHAYEHA